MDSVPLYFFFSFAHYYLPQLQDCLSVPVYRLKNESTVDSDSLCLLHTSLISPITTFPCFSTIMAFSGVSMSVFSQISFKFAELLTGIARPLDDGVLWLLLCIWTGFAEVISLLASSTCVEGIAKRRAAQGRSLSWLASRAHSLKSIALTSFFNWLSVPSSLRVLLSKFCRSITASNPNDDATVSRSEEAFPWYGLPFASRNESISAWTNSSGKLQSNPAISNSVNSKSRLFRTKIELPWIQSFTISYFELGYFEFPAISNSSFFPYTLNQPRYFELVKNRART